MAFPIPTRVQLQRPRRSRRCMCAWAAGARTLSGSGWTGRILAAVSPLAQALLAWGRRLQYLSRAGGRGARCWRGCRDWWGVEMRRWQATTGRWRPAGGATCHAAIGSSSPWTTSAAELRPAHPAAASDRLEGSRCRSTSRPGGQSGPDEAGLSVRGQVAQRLGGGCTGSESRHAAHPRPPWSHQLMVEEVTKRSAAAPPLLREESRPRCDGADELVVCQRRGDSVEQFGTDG